MGYQKSADAKASRRAGRLKKNRFLQNSPATSPCSAASPDLTIVVYQFVAGRQRKPHFGANFGPVLAPVASASGSMAAAS